MANLNFLARMKNKTLNISDRVSKLVFHLLKKKLNIYLITKLRLLQKFVNKACKYSSFFQYRT